MKPITFTSYLDYLPKLKLTHITVPAEIVDKVGGIGTRLMVSINGNESFHGGMVAKGEGTAYITVNKARQKKWDLNENEELTITIELDHSKYGVPVPEEFEALLEQEREGAKLFEQLAPSEQRYIINYVNGVKSSQKKIDRAILLINNLKTMPDKFDFRYLLGMPPRED
ncbi:MAG: YdeI/OmpD-associated family protein [Balneolaceae bacterium]|nr:YdeI/OmpD-associated family protein [Balneolaceae bacterium]MBO6545594.1 YdeI/OmpD-associated family protein [Balneolaceae bacterium]MBO6646990.1 YdeI/OmpD-associated family protein [Balneolaceae bacterium]